MDKMVKLSTVKGWGYSDNMLGWELNESSDVTLIYCKLCREFYDEKKWQRKLARSESK